jgi:hypothetical protein
VICHSDPSVTLDIDTLLASPIGYKICIVFILPCRIYVVELLLDIALVIGHNKRLEERSSGDFFNLAYQA